MTIAMIYSRISTLRVPASRAARIGALGALVPLLLAAAACSPGGSSGGDEATDSAYSNLSPSGRRALADSTLDEAERLLQRRENQMAAERLTKVIELEPANQRAHFLMGRLHCQEKRFKEAILALETAVEIEDEWLANLWLGMALDGAQRIGPALEAFKRAAELNPANPDARHNLGYGFRRAGQTDKALEILSQLLDEYPERVGTRYQLAVAQEERGEEEKAKVNLRKVVEAMPSHRLAVVRLQALDSGFDLETMIQKASERKRQVGQYIERSSKSFMARDYRKAIELAQKAIALGSGSPKLDAHAYNSICLSHGKLEQWQQAVTACQQAVKLDPAFVQARTNLVKARSKL